MQPEHILILHTLKGAAASLLLALSLNPGPLGARDLARFTGWSENAVREGLCKLEAIGLAKRRRRYNGWQLAEAGRQWLRQKLQGEAQIEDLVAGEACPPQAATPEASLSTTAPADSSPLINAPDEASPTTSASPDTSLSLSAPAEAYAAPSSLPPTQFWLTFPSRKVCDSESIVVNLTLRELTSTDSLNRANRRFYDSNRKFCERPPPGAAIIPINRFGLRLSVQKYLQPGDGIPNAFGNETAIALFRKSLKQEARSLSKYPGQEFDLLQILEGLAAFMLVIRPDLDLLGAGVMVVGRKDGRRRADVVHQAH
jgi:hypothetical protein